MKASAFDVADRGLAAAGHGKVDWAGAQMPVLGEIRRRFEREKPLEGVRIAACLHVTSETANLAMTLAGAGAAVRLCASNPLSTQDDVAAALADRGIAVFARRGEDRETYYEHIRAALDPTPHITLDDGADLVSTLHSECRDKLPQVWGGLEETTTGVLRLRAMAAAAALRYPIFAVNDASTKYLFDNRYGTGQSTIDGIVRATNVLLAGKTMVVAGYGWCGRGLALRARGMGARVIVTEVDPLRALEAAMDGNAVLSMRQAASEGDIFCTVTGNKGVLRREHFEKMRDGAILSNAGHFNVEIDEEALRGMAREVRRNIRPSVDQYILPDGRRIVLLAEGRLVNLACAEGHPPAVMDMSFSTQALMAEHLHRHRNEVEPGVHPVPRSIEQWIAKIKLASLRIEIDALTEEQRAYLASWQEGT